jgi:hypothetical protein
MLMAAERQAPIRRLVLNDFWRARLGHVVARIGAYLRNDWRFGAMKEVEAHLREIHAPFGALTNAQWRQPRRAQCRRRRRRSAPLLPRSGDRAAIRAADHARRGPLASLGARSSAR